MYFSKKVKLSFIIDFRSGKAPILVATDVAARGLGKIKFIQKKYI